VTQLSAFYDNYAKSMYGTFERVIAQIPCEAPAAQRYSLARTCEDCKKTYKKWLCAVAIPRCEDFTTDNALAVARNVNAAFPNGTKLPDEVRAQFRQPANNVSRNPRIDTDVAPGPYKEILPCDMLCYELVQSCPAAMGFGCPQPGMLNFNQSYGRGDGTDGRCNYPGVPRAQAGSPRGVVVSSWALLGAMAASAIALSL